MNIRSSTGQNPFFDFFPIPFFPNQYWVTVTTVMKWIEKYYEACIAVMKLIENIMKPAIAVVKWSEKHC